MADERPESALENLTRLNLLDVVLERTRALNKVFEVLYVTLILEK